MKIKATLKSLAHSFGFLSTVVATSVAITLVFLTVGEHFSDNPENYDRAMGSVASGLAIVLSSIVVLTSARPGHTRSKFETASALIGIFIAVLALVVAWKPETLEEGFWIIAISFGVPASAAVIGRFYPSNLVPRFRGLRNLGKSNRFSAMKSGQDEPVESGDESPSGASTSSTELVDQTDTEQTGVEQTSQLLAPLLQVAGLVAPAIASLAVLTAQGNIGRAQRNEPECLILGLSLLIAAGAVWIISDYVRKSSRWTIRTNTAKKFWKRIGNFFWPTKRKLQVLAVILAAAGNIIAIAVTVETASDSITPRIRTELADTARQITATVTASQLKNHDRLAVYIDGMSTRKVDGVPAPVTTPLEQIHIGPDGDGTVDETLKTYIPANRFESVRVKVFTGDRSDQCPVRVAKPSAKGGLPRLQLYPDPQGSSTACAVVSLEPKPKPAGGS